MPAPARVAAPVRRGLSESFGNRVEVRSREVAHCRNRDARGGAKPVAALFRAVALRGGEENRNSSQGEPRRSWYSPSPAAAPASSKLFRLRRAEAAARAPGTEMTSKRVVVEWSSSSGESQPPVITNCRETEMQAPALPVRQSPDRARRSPRVAADGAPS